MKRSGPVNRSVVLSIAGISPDQLHLSSGTVA